MNKKQLIVVLVIMICLSPLQVDAATDDGPLLGILGYEYENIEWISHEPYLPEEMAHDVISPDEADYRGQIDTGMVDIDGDGNDETIKVIWGHGVSDHSLTIELYNEQGKLATLRPTGIQPNFKVEDIDSDGTFEIIIWGAVSDPNMSQLIDDESKPFEGHSADHLFEVATYKLKDGKYELSDKYISKNKYEPFCREQPK